MKKLPPHLMVLVAERALVGSESLSTPERADLLIGVSHILPDRRAAKAARDEAFHLREAERSQLVLAGLLREARQ